MSGGPIVYLLERHYRRVNSVKVSAIPLVRLAVPSVAWLDASKVSSISLNALTPVD